MKLGVATIALAALGLPSGQARAQVTVQLPAESPSSPDGTTAAKIDVPLPSDSGENPQKDDQKDDTQDSGIQSVPIGIHGRPDINPYERDIDMTVPLTFLSKSLGEVPMRLTADDRFLLDTTVFLERMETVLNDTAHAALSAKLAGLKEFGPDDLVGTGVGLTYDPSTLAVVVLQVSPELRATQNLFAPPRDDKEYATLAPSSLSGFFNLNVVETYIWEEKRVATPTINLDGAIRFDGIVFEGDAQVGERPGLVGNDYRFTRNYARLVYDQPEQYRRFYLGDLDPEVRGQQSYVSMGGIGVLRQQRRFNAFRSAILQSNRELILQRESTVRFMRNGALYRELRLQPGRYDFSSLPLIAGSNDIAIQVTDNSGAVQNLSYQQYLDPIDLDPGDYEYGAYLGPTSQTFAGAPDYRGPVAFSGFFRKAFFNRPALGVGAQLSEGVQTLTGQTQFVLANGGRLQIDGGASNSKIAGQGFAAGLSYEHFFDRNGLSDSLTFRGDYLSPKFATLGNKEGINTVSFSLSAQYTHQFDLRFTTTTTASYLKSRGGQGDSYRIATAGYYRVDREWSVRVGAEYAKYPSAFSQGNGFAFTIGLVFQPDYRRRAEARLESRNNLAELSYNQSGLNQLNSLGFGGILSRQDGNALAQGYATYAANRFNTSLSHASYGPSFSDFGAVNATTATFGTTIAFADGMVGVGRRINDSFMLLAPHKNLGKRSVAAGQSLAQNNYISRSGTLGAAVNNFLGSYSMQSVQYDVEDPPPGYDIGPGVFRVNPPYKSGYRAVIGTDAFATAMGTLELTPGKPVSLAGGRATLQDVAEGETPKPIPFFTNSVGRFAIANLLPGRRYVVETFGSNGSINRAFEFVVPTDTDGLLDLGTVRYGSKN